MKKLILLSIFFIYGKIILADEHSEHQQPTIIDSRDDLKPIKIKLNDSGDQYVQLGVWNQVWFRYLENNPGTAVNGEQQKHTIDAGIRRLRLTTQFKLSPRYQIFIQLGSNNQSFISGGGQGTGGSGAGKKAPFFVHDAYNEFLIFKNKQHQQKPVSVYLGAGLHAWTGISRLSNSSSSRMLTADLPLLNFPTIEISDQMGRQFGVFSHGELNKVAYRVNINKPFATNQQPIYNQAVDNNRKGNLSYAGYFNYRFNESENQSVPFLPQTYFGEKNIFNIGAGFYHAPHATMSLAGINQQETSHHNTSLGLDIFVDKKIGKSKKKMALSLYSVFYKYQHGPNYFRSIGIMNPGVASANYNGVTALDGYGNSTITFGTGNLWYTQAGLVLPRFSKLVKLQPYVVYAHKKLDVLKQTSHNYDLGLNFLFQNHHSKLSVQYANRPIFDHVNHLELKRKGDYLACFQIMF